MGTLSVDGGEKAQLVVAWLGFALVVLTASLLDIFLVTGGGKRGATRSVPCDIERVSSAEDTASCARSADAQRVARQIVFWLGASALFNVYVFALLGAQGAGAWLYGYILEYLLSVDNLFVFRMVFQAYSTPAKQVDKALFWGIGVAVVLRLVFFSLGTGILALGFFARLFFGLCLIYSAVKTVRDSEDDEDDPRENPCVRLVTRLLPLYEGYTDDGTFFVRAPAVCAAGEPAPSVIGTPTPASSLVELSGFMDDHVRSHAQAAASAAEADGPDSMESPPPGVATNDSFEVDGPVRTRVTLLFLVVLSLGIIDVVFAVDSVTAKISSIENFSSGVNLFLNLTSSAFAMFVLRTLYFIIDIMVHMFRFLSYGVGTVLALIGIKLILSGWVDIGMLESMLTIVFLLFSSVLASVVCPKKDKDKDVEKVPQELCEQVSTSCAAAEAAHSGCTPGGSRCRAASEDDGVGDKDPDED